MSELSFLLDLLLNEKLPKVVKEKITARVKEVEEYLAKPVITQPGWIPQVQMPPVPPPAERVVNGAVQSPSTIAAMKRHENPAESQPGAVVASVAAAVAIQNREQALAAAISGKPEPGRTSPRKF